MTRTLPMWEWQWVDSEVARVQQQGDGLCVHLSAAVARAVGASVGAVPSDWGYALGVVLDLKQVQVLQLDVHALGRIAEADMRVDGQPFHSLPLPETRVGATHLVLRFANGAALHLTAQGWQSGFAAEPRFRESYAC